MFNLVLHIHYGIQFREVLALILYVLYNADTPVWPAVSKSVFAENRVLILVTWSTLHTFIRKQDISLSLHSQTYLVLQIPTAEKATVSSIGKI